ncbi:MAG: haloacid dehalogenase-like hydrolase [Phycisphaerales bacterium]|nr:haloacid dehalogenase-like hydrolase [Phycisphaerales bacterium]
MSEILILFDIDGTLLRTNGAGVSGFVEAGQRVFGIDFSLEGLLVGGQLDPLILQRALDKLGIEHNDAHLDIFRPHYHECLKRHFDSGDRSAVAMPGVHDLLNQLADHEAFDVGVLTGNLRETGELKLTAAGIDHAHFHIHAWGDEGEARHELPPVAMSRWQAHRSADRVFEQTVIIGDTVHDVSCGKANGCRVLAVCTGVDDRETLEQTEADLVVDDLSDTDGIMSWLMRA